MPATCVLYLVRHGEVSNPNHIVYGDLPGFHLSAVGVLQVHVTGRHLGDAGVDLVVTSPLIRAIETATAIAGRHDLEPRVDRRLTESGQFPHWTGHRWESISTLYPGELESYLTNAPDAGGTEQLGAIAQRYRSVAEEAVKARYTTLVIVGHQDPVQAARLSLTGRDLKELRLDPPRHGEAIKLTRSDQGQWTEASRWSPQVAAPEAQGIL